MESAENRKSVSLSSHSPWKSLRDSHIPTAPAALPLSQIKSQKGFSRISLSFRLILRLENAGFQPLASALARFNRARM
jgi:hypothetical protein